MKRRPAAQPIEPCVGPSAQRTHSAAHDQLTFAIVQGSTYEGLRRQHAQALAALDFPGYAIGGLWVGEEQIARS